MCPRPHHPAACAALVSALLAVPIGCGYRQTTNCPTPAASGLNTRDLIDPPAQAEVEQLLGLDQFNETARKVGARIKAELLKNAPPGRPPRNVLCLSGGGSYGAYSAGVLVGWTAAGRPAVLRRGDRDQHRVP